MKNNNIIVKGARENNLKDIDIEIPKDKFVVITGPSGSGKSTLAFDTIYAEGRRRYVESLSAYARQFLGNSEKPDVDSIDGLAPAISIDQKTGSNNPRSTVGTVTEIYDYLRLLYARIGVPICPTHKIEIKGNTPAEITKAIEEKYKGQRIQIYARAVNLQKGTHKRLLEELLKSGYTRVIVNGDRYDLVDEIEAIKLHKNKKSTIDVVIDRLQVEDESRSRIHTSVEKALELGHNTLIVEEGADCTEFSADFACPKCGFTVPELEPRLFSFNAPLGACKTCSGLGNLKEPDIELMVPDKELSINEGAIQVNGYNAGSGRDTYYYTLLAAAAKAYNIDLDKPFKELTQDEINVLFYGTEEEILVNYESTAMSFEKNMKFEGISNNIMRRFMETSSSQQRTRLDSLMSDHSCPTCKGTRLSEEVLAIRVNNLNIHEVTELSIVDGVLFFQGIQLTDHQKAIVKMVLEEVKARYKFLENVGLGYLNLSRQATTLSGGEAQRIRLATQIGSKLTGVLYVLDEPSIGLHQRDNHRLIETLKGMRDLGNSLLVVEHDEDTMLESDYIIDMGPKSGEYGGEIIAFGTPKEIQDNPESLTGRYLSGKEEVEIPKKKRKQDFGFIEVKGAAVNNLKNINVKFPLENFVCVTGVSGSGKSSLVNEILYKRLHNEFSRENKFVVGKHKSITGVDQIRKVIDIDQKPIGRTPRSNPATYVGVFDDIRDLFATTKEAKVRGYQKGRFSFNVRGGRCDACSGDGVLKIEMNFLPDVYVECEVCKGKRYNADVLEIYYKDKNIADVLDLSITSALEFFGNIPTIKRKLQTLVDVGLGYLKVGTPATVLSGGEAQRVKLAKELHKLTKGKTVYILDEPTTGLHVDDVRKLIDVLQKLVDKGNSVIVIEHNLDLIKVADYIIDIGPEGGTEGGEIVYAGTVEKIVTNNKSYTGQYLAKYFKS